MMQISKISNNNRAKKSTTTNPTIHLTSLSLSIETAVVGEQENNAVVFAVAEERGNEESIVAVNFELFKSAHLTIGVLSRTTDGQG